MRTKAARETHGVSTRGIFGEATGAEPATPGSYGRAPAGFRLPSATGLGPVRLLHDPDNLGIEVYADRPRTAWRRVGRELMMATDPFDMAGLLEAAGSELWKGVPAETAMGHVHLHVGDLSRAAAFFSEGLGFDQTVWGYPGALFLGAGGYHHHLGTNLWAGPRAARPSSDEAQLLEWTIDLPTKTGLEAAVGSLEEREYDVAWEEIAGFGRTATTRDPWGTAVRLRVAAAFDPAKISPSEPSQETAVDPGGRMTSPVDDRTAARRKNEI